MQVAEFWPLVLNDVRLSFAVLSFKWTNLAANNAGVTCVIVGLDRGEGSAMLMDGELVREVDSISPYLTAGSAIYVAGRQKPLSDVSEMLLGNFAKDGGHLLLSKDEVLELDLSAQKFIRPMFGAREFIQGAQRYCLWIEDEDAAEAAEIRGIKERLLKVAAERMKSPKPATAQWASRPHRFVEIRSPTYTSAVIVPRVSSENRPYLPVGFLPERSIITEAFGFYDAPLWNMALIASRLHLVWIATVCGKLETRYRYSNTLGWNTFPVPPLTEKNKADLTRSAEHILLAREAHFPATIADLYDLDAMPADLRAAHDRNDELLERIYIGRRFKNDTERLEKLFERYTKMTAEVAKRPSVSPRKRSEAAGNNTGLDL
jgi:hypothetical protein